jgi:hypothetical protein
MFPSTLAYFEESAEARRVELEVRVAVAVGIFVVSGWEWRVSQWNFMDEVQVFDVEDEDTMDDGRSYKLVSFDRSIGSSCDAIDAWSNVDQ